MLFTAKTFRDTARRIMSAPEPLDLAYASDLLLAGAMVVEQLQEAERSIEIICEMARSLNDPTAWELIQDILHPEERTGP